MQKRHVNMSARFKLLTSMEDSEKLALLLELPKGADRMGNIASKEFLTIDDLINVCNCMEIRDEPIDWIRMIFDPTVAVDPTETDKTNV